MYEEIPWTFYAVENLDINDEALFNYYKTLPSLNKKKILYIFIKDQDKIKIKNKDQVVKTFSLKVSNPSTFLRIFNEEKKVYDEYLLE